MKPTIVTEFNWKCECGGYIARFVKLSEEGPTVECASCHHRWYVCLIDEDNGGDAPI